jgi:RNA polymerase sigma factor (sigma-70 family)
MSENEFDKKFYEFVGISTSGVSESSALFRYALKFFTYWKGDKIYYDREGAKELVMNTISDMHIKVKEGKIPLDKYLKQRTYIILQNKFNDEYRKKKVRKIAHEQMSSYGSAGGKKGSVEDEQGGVKMTTQKTYKSSEKLEKRTIGRQIFDRLPERCRDILDLVYQEFRQEEIAEKLSISQGQVSIRINNCREELYRLANA